MDSFFKFFDPRLVDTVREGFSMTEEALNDIRDAIKNVSAPADNAALVDAIEKINSAMDRQSMALSLIQHADISRDFDDYKSIEEMDAKHWLVGNSLYRAKVEDSNLDDGENNEEHFTRALVYSTTTDLKKIIDKMNFNEMKTAYEMVNNSLVGDAKYYDAEVVKARTGVSVRATSHFHEECVKTVRGIKVEVDGYDLDAIIAQELIVHMYTKSNTKYKDETGDNLMVVGIKAKEDSDGVEAFNLAKAMLSKVSAEERFDKNADVKRMFGHELTDVKDELDEFAIDAYNIRLFEKIRSLKLKYTLP